MTTYIGAPPTHCDTCHTNITDEFYDARLPRLGGWANVCHTCFIQYGCSLGVGYGQHYVLDGDQFVRQDP